MHTSINILHVFRRAVARHSARVFLFDRSTAVTYAEADARSNAIAAELIARGIADGATLGLAAADRVALWLAIIGAWKAGALPSLIDARTPPEQLPYFVEDSGARLIAAAPEVAGRLQAAGAAAVVDLDELGESGATAPVDRHGPEAPLYLSYTSGTTGMPKGAILLSGPVTLATGCIADRLQLSCGDSLLTTTPISSSFQLVAALMPAIHAGAAVGLAAGQPGEAIWEMARRHGTTILVAYPLTLADIVNAPQAAAQPCPFRLALSGGAALAPRLKQDYRARLGIPLLESYGQSELGGFMALGAPHDPAAVLAAGFAGRPLPDRLAYIGDNDGAELPAGTVGEVLVSHGFFAAYRNKPAQTEEARRGGVLHTGDLGVANAEGYLKVLGRLSEAEGARRRGGFLRSVEDTYYEHEAVLHAVVVERAGAVEGFVELRGGQLASAAALQQFVAERVGTGLAPRQTTILEQMPRTFSGKADRLRLAR